MRANALYLGSQLPREDRMADVTRVIIGSVSAEELPRAIVDAALKALEADDVSLLLPTGNDELYVAHASGLSAEVKATARVKIGEGVAGRAAATREPKILESDLGADRGYTENAARRVRSSIIYPLVLGEDLLGVLTVNRREGRPAFVEGDLERTGILSAEVSLALRNAALVRRLIGAERLVAVGQLAAGIAHEVNNPVACILANLEYVREGLVDVTAGRPVDASAMEEAVQAIADSIQAAHRIRDVVAELRRFSIGRGAPTDRVDVGATMRAAVQMTTPRTRTRGATTLRQDEDVWISGEGPRLLQVFVSAILHVHATATVDDPSPAIAISIERHGDALRIRIDGPTSVGAAPRLGGVFSIDGDSSELGGLGIGLYAARDIIRHWGGDLSELRDDGRFSVFLRVPAASEGAR